MSFLAIYACGILITFGFQAMYEVMRTVPPHGDQRCQDVAITLASLLWPMFWLAFILIGMVFCWARLALYFARRRLRKLGG